MKSNLKEAERAFGIAFKALLRARKVEHKKKCLEEFKSFCRAFARSKTISHDKFAVVLFDILAQWKLGCTMWTDGIWQRTWEEIKSLRTQIFFKGE